MGTNYGGASISVDNKLMILAANRPVPSNPANIDLFATEYHVDYRDLDGSAVYMWSTLVPLGEGVNTPQGWEAQPSISGDGKTLFFAGARAESTPIPTATSPWTSSALPRLDNGRWGPAEKLPAPINSEAHDKAPFLHPDGKTLYFSSNRTPSGGGYDLWMSQQRQRLVQWMDCQQPWTTREFLRRRSTGLVVSGDGKPWACSQPPTTAPGAWTSAPTPCPTELRPGACDRGDEGDVGWPVPEGELTVSIEYVQSKRVEQVQFSKEDGRFAAVVQLPEGEDVVHEPVEGGSKWATAARRCTKTAPTCQGRRPCAHGLCARTSIQRGDEGTGMFELADVQFATKHKASLCCASVLWSSFSALANHLDRNVQNRVLDVDGHTDDVGGAQDNLAAQCGPRSGREAAP